MENTSPRRGILWLSVLDQESPVHQIFVNCTRHFHVTLQFGVRENEIPAGILGQTFSVRVTDDCFNSRIQALRVELPSEVRHLCRNGVPHMTISMIPGVNPVESNEMFQGSHISEPVDFDLLLVCEFSPFN